MQQQRTAHSILLGGKLYWKDLHAAGREEFVQHLGTKP